MHITDRQVQDLQTLATELERRSNMEDHRGIATDLDAESSRLRMLARPCVPIKDVYEIQQVGQRLTRMGFYDEACRIFQPLSAVMVGPDLGNLLRDLADVMRRMPGQNLGAVERLLNKSANLLPEDEFPIPHAASLHFKARLRRQQAGTQKFRGRKLLLEDGLDLCHQALRIILEADEADPELIWCLLDTAAIERLLGRPKMAKAHARSARRYMETNASSEITERHWQRADILEIYGWPFYYLPHLRWALGS
jgi:hypothetical protein